MDKKSVRGTSSNTPHSMRDDEANRQWGKYLEEISARTPFDELLTETSTIASFCYLLRRTAPNRKKKQEFLNLAKEISWLDEACENASELLKEFPVLKNSVVGSPHSVGPLRRDRNWHRTILNLGGDALSRVTTPGGVCVDVRRPTGDGKFVFVADLLKKNWPTIQSQLRQLPDFDLQALREVLRDESEIVRRLTEDGRVVGQTDTLKKSPKKNKRRTLNKHGKACIAEFKQYQKSGDTQFMRDIVRDYVAEYPELKESSLYKTLTDNSDQWKP